MKYNFATLELLDGKLKFIDQTKLPVQEEYAVTDNYERIAEAIECLEIRGAPAIGIAAAYALALAMKNTSSEETFYKAYKRLAATRPTAVNLFWALDLIKSEYEKNKSNADLYSLLIKKAKDIHQDDIEKCDNIAKNGLSVFTKKMNALTHCNAGSLATGGAGTALSIIKLAAEKGLINHAYADETRPLFQGSRLTAFEFEKAGIPFSIITDSTAAFAMKQGMIDIVITGADRIAANGDSANKIGTYGLAVNCKHHNIPFYIAAPTSTIDPACATGDGVKIELRNKSEVLSLGGLQISKNEYETYSPAFDVTPSELITGIITEEGLYRYPYNFKNVRNS